MMTIKSYHWSAEPYSSPTPHSQKGGVFNMQNLLLRGVLILFNKMVVTLHMQQIQF